MPRQKRSELKAITKNYHIMMRGVNRQNIFLNDFDKEKFIKEIIKTKEKYNYKIYAYVLMNNHVHLAIFDTDDEMSNIVHDLCMNYAMYFNKKYERVGHLFQNRFKSKRIETESYLMNLVRYIHKNPIGNYKIYKWSSYREYVERNYITDVDFILEMFSEIKEKAIVKFKEFSDSNENTDKNKEKEYEFENDKISDESAMEEIQKIKNIGDIRKVDKKKRNEYINKVLEIEGINIKQAARILGLDRKMVERARMLNKK